MTAWKGISKDSFPALRHRTTPNGRHLPAYTLGLPGLQSQLCCSYFVAYWSSSA
jgi:hypothetical protein